MKRDALGFLLSLCFGVFVIGFALGMRVKTEIYVKHCVDQGRNLVATHQYPGDIYCVWQDSDGATRKEKAK